MLIIHLKRVAQLVFFKIETCARSSQSEPFNPVSVIAVGFNGHFN